MQKIRTIIVDDEPEAREGIKLLLQDDHEIEVLGLCKNGIEAIDMVGEHHIDLMFLDIQMPVVNGFEVVNSIPKNRMPLIIFVTAYDQYAIKAFEIHAIDYILKPFTNQRFTEGLARAKQLISQQKLQAEQEKLRSLSEDLTDKMVQAEPILISNAQSQRLVVKQSGKVLFVPTTDIIWLEAYDYYVKIHVKNQFYLVRESLKKLSEKLPSPDFIRIHKSSIVNTSYISSIDSIENGEYLISIGEHQELKVSRNYQEGIKNLIKT